jgi:PAN domain
MRKALIAALVIGAFIAGHLFPGLKTRSPEYALVNGQLIRIDPDGTKTPLGPPMGTAAPEESNASVPSEPEPSVAAPSVPAPAEPGQSVAAKTEVDRVPIEKDDQPPAGQAPPAQPTPPTGTTVPPLQTPPPTTTTPSPPQTPSQVTATVPVPPAMTNYKTYENRDLNSNDIETLKNVDLSSCVSKCRLDPQCRAYSFDRWNGYCFLKSRGGPLLLDPRSVTGVREDLPAQPISAAPVKMERYRGKAFPGTGYRSISVGFDVCETTCRNEETCIAYTFHKNERKCHMFSTTGKYLTNPLADSGAKRQEP